MFCDKCGAALPDGARFCDKCGNAVEVIGAVSGYGNYSA